MLEASIQLNSTSSTFMTRQKGRCLPSVEQVSKYQLISPTDFNFFQAEEGDSPKCKSLKRWVEPTSIKQTMPSASSFVVNSDPIHKFYLKRTWYSLPNQGSHSPRGVFLYSKKTSGHARFRNEIHLPWNKSPWREFPDTFASLSEAFEQPSTVEDKLDG